MTLTSNEPQATRDRWDAERLARMWQRQSKLTQMAQTSRATAIQQRTDAVHRRDRARQRAGQRIVPMWKARKAGYERGGPVLAMWTDEDATTGNGRSGDGRSGDGGSGAARSGAELLQRLAEVSELITSSRMMTSGVTAERLGDAAGRLDQLIGEVRRTLDGDPPATPDRPEADGATRDPRFPGALARIAESLLRRADGADVLEEVAQNARAALDGCDVWIAGSTPAGPARPGSAPATELPIVSDGKVVAVLCVAARDGSGGPSERDLADWRMFASRVGLMIGLARGRALHEDRLVRTVEQLQHALDSRVVIEQAKGIISADLRVGVDAAFERMRKHARSHQVTVQQVAAAVVNLGLRP